MITVRAELFPLKKSIHQSNQYSNQYGEMHPDFPKRTFFGKIGDKNQFGILLRYKKI